MPHNNRSLGRRKSNFPANTAIPSGSTFDFVSSGVNYKITIEDFQAGIGVTGALVQDGAATGTPVLDTQGSVNNIRNVEDGPGIMSSVSPENGLKLEHNFQRDTSASAVVDSLSQSSPTFASIAPGTGIEVSKDGNVITVAATGALPATKTVSINSASDWPNIVSGLHDLDAGTTYFVQNDVEISSGLRLKDGTSVIGASTIGPLLTFTGAGALFNANDATILVQNLHYTCPNGKAFSVTDTTGNTKICNIINAQCEQAVDYGDFTALFAVNVFNSNCLNNTATGPKFFGSGWGLIAFDRFGLFTASGSYVGIDLGACVADGIEYGDLFISGPSGAVALTGAAGSANITSGNQGTITNCNFIGDITPVTSIDPASDVRWSALGNDGIADSRTDALMSIQGNVTETVIAVAGTPVKMAGTWTDEGSSLFTTDATGRMTYIGERNARLPIDGTLSLLTATGGTKQVSAYIAVNGSPVSATKKTATASSSQAASITMVWQRVFAPGDFVEMFLANEDDTVNVIGTSGVGRIN